MRVKGLNKFQYSVYRCGEYKVQITYTEIIAFIIYMVTASCIVILYAKSCTTFENWLKCIFAIILIKITKPSVDNHRVTVDKSSSPVELMCSLNVYIPSTVAVLWLHIGSIAMTTTPNEVIQSGSTVRFLLEDLQLSDAGVYQCVFTDQVNIVLGFHVVRSTINMWNMLLLGGSGACPQKKIENYLLWDWFSWQFYKNIFI